MLLNKPCQFFTITDDPEYCIGATLLCIDTPYIRLLLGSILYHFCIKTSYKIKEKDCLKYFGLQGVQVPLKNSVNSKLQRRPPVEKIHLTQDLCIQCLLQFDQLFSEPFLLLVASVAESTVDDVSN